MTKQKRSGKISVQAKSAASAPLHESSLPSFLRFIEHKRNQRWIVALLAFILYVNTLNNQFALDDGMVLRDNRVVQRGISAIPDILTQDSFYGAIGNTTNLTGGRYRPLSLIFFAIEVSFFGINPAVHHFINVLLYALTAIILLNFLRRFVFPRYTILSFITVVLFVVHPVHTEVVANIKSRDEILSLLFLILTLHYLLIYLKEKKEFKILCTSALFFVPALLSKENGLIFLVIVPLTIYIFTNRKLSGIISPSLPFMAVIILYFIFRVSLLGFRNNDVQEVMDNPYLLATTPEKFATIFYVLLKYLQLLFFPQPLTYDYSYQQIPYRDFTDFLVWFSIVVYLSLGIYALILLRKKDILSWCIIFFFGTLFIVSNMFFNIGAPMAERFLYQASFPFLIGLTEVANRTILKFQPNPKILTISSSVILLIILTTSSYRVVKRNLDWRSDDTLFLHDVKNSAGSARANTYAGVALVRKTDQSDDSLEIRQLALKSLDYFRRSEQIKRDYLPTFLNMGVAYSRLDSIDAAEEVWNRAREIAPDDPKLTEYDEYLFQYFLIRGLKEGRDSNFFAAVIDLEKAVKYNPLSDAAWFNLGGAYYTVKNFSKAKEAWQKALQLNPKHEEARIGLSAIP